MRTKKDILKSIARTNIRLAKVIAGYDDDETPNGSKKDILKYIARSNKSIADRVSQYDNTNND